MKNIKFLFFAIALMSFSFSMISCGGKTSGDKAKMEEANQSGPEYTSAYVCPMHCEGSGSASEGKCPVCGMDYVVNEDLKKDDDGHDHDEEDGHSH